MKYLFFLSLLLIRFNALSFETYSGYIQNKGAFKILRVHNQGVTQNFTLTSENPEIKAQISKLKTNDFLSGIGISANNAINIQSIDFIGLGEFLGLWISKIGLLSVADFTNLQIYAAVKDMSLKTPKSKLNYSITPGSGNSWVLFLSDENQIYFSNLFMTDNKAVIRFYSTETGAFIDEVSMNKINK